MMVAVTGGNGYIGSQLRKKLLNEEDIQGKYLTIDDEDEKIYFHTDFSADDLIRHFSGADTVVHLAAVRGGTSITDFTDNERITENVLLAMQRTGTKKIVFASSIAVYSDPGRIPWQEDTSLAPVSLYGASKVACESIIRYYASRWNLDACILRFAPLYGENDHNKRMIANFVRQAIRHERLTIDSKSSAQRDFIYRDDAVDALIWAIRSEERGVSTYNIGSGEPRTNLEIAQIINSAMKNPTPIEYKEDQPETMPPAYFDINKARRTGFVPKYDMESAMQRIAFLEGIR